MEYRGQQVFIIHPDPILRESLVQVLRDEEYETFGLGGTDPVLLENRRDAVVFMAPEDGAGWNDRLVVQDLLDDSRPHRLVALGMPGRPKGYDETILGTDSELPDRIVAYLNSMEARGHRHYVRFGSQNASIATFEFHKDGKRYAGIIHDISARGMALTFKPEPGNMRHLEVSDMQLNLPGHRLVLPGRLTTSRKVAGQTIHIFMFARDLGSDMKDELHNFIYASLETKLSHR